MLDMYSFAVRESATVPQDSTMVWRRSSAATNTMKPKPRKIKNSSLSSPSRQALSFFLAREEILVPPAQIDGEASLSLPG